MAISAHGITTASGRSNRDVSAMPTLNSTIEVASTYHGLLNFTNPLYRKVTLSPIRDHNAMRFIMRSSTRFVTQAAPRNNKPPATAATTPHAIQISNTLRHIETLTPLGSSPTGVECNSSPVNQAQANL